MQILSKIFSPLFLFFSSILLFYIFYKSELVLGGQTRHVYLIYYIISILLILFSLITFFINKKIKEYVILVLISSVFALYLFEGYLQFFKQKFDAKKYGKLISIKFESISIIHLLWISKHNSTYVIVKMYS